jgi:hypothetical protein
VTHADAGEAVVGELAGWPPAGEAVPGACDAAALAGEAAFAGGAVLVD